MNLIFHKILDSPVREGTIYREQLESLKSLMEVHLLEDIFRINHPDARVYTWKPRGLNPNNTFRRLDYFLTSEEATGIIKTFPPVQLIHSDHCIVRMELKLELDVIEKVSFWKHNDKINDDPDFLKEIEEKIPNLNFDELENKEDPRVTWEVRKYNIMKIGRKHSKIRALKEAEEYNRARDKVIEATRECTNNPTETNKAGLRASERELQRCIDIETEKLRFKAQVNDFEKNERSTKYFYRKWKARRAKGNIKKLNVNGTVTENMNEILKEAERHFSSMARKDPDVEEVNANIDDSDDKYKNIELNPELKLTEEQKADCDKEITIEEMKAALADMEGGKSPGNDGLTTDLYKAIWPWIGEALFESFKYSIEHGELSESQKRGIIRLIEKKGKDRLKIENWRPITLLNTDTKIFSKMFAKRFRKYMDFLICEDQTGYKKGTSISETIRLLKDLIEYCENNQIEGKLIALDFAKAFDSLSHCFLWLCLRRANFGEYYINAVKTMYKNSVSAVCNGGYTTNYFQIGRGIKQGDCLSPNLFILAIEPLLQSIRNKLELSGIKIGNRGTVNAAAYVDDANVVLDAEAEVDKLFEMLDDFRETSVLRVNVEKTNGILLGQGFPEIKIGNIHYKKSLKVLGIHLGQKSQELDEQNMGITIELIRKLTKEWGERDLTVLGKVLISKSMLLS